MPGTKGNKSDKKSATKQPQSPKEQPKKGDQKGDDNKKQGGQPKADCKPHLHPSPSVVQSLSIFPPPHLHLSPPPQIVPSSLLAAWKKKNKPDHGFELKKKRLSPSLMEFH
uniref:Si:ch211-255g12.6 n=1 Tax=Tetraodon nigroviridis TaxID=99883 RepID=H3C079_TETNG